MYKSLFASLFVLLSVAASAQPNKKVGPALSKFLNTEFMVKYRDLRIEAESAVIGVQSRKDEIKPADFIRLRTAYDQTATRANQLMEGVKQDFLNQKKLKSIAEFPDMYSDGLRFKLQDLSSFYTTNFQQTLADASVAKTDKDGSAVLLLVVELISLTKGLTNYFAEIKREARQYTDAHLQEHLVQPYRWRYWDELSGSVSPYEKFEKSDALNVEVKEDPLDQQLQKMNQTISNFPVKQQTSNDGNSGSNFNVPLDTPAAANSTFKYEDWSPTDTPPADTVGQRNLAPATAKKPVLPAKAATKSSPNLPKSDHR